MRWTSTSAGEGTWSEARGYSVADQRIKCVECGQIFIWSHSEQRYFREHGLTPPKRCRGCRSLRRRDRDSEMRRPVALPVKASSSRRERAGADRSFGSPVSQGTRTARPARSRGLRQFSWWANPMHRFRLLTFGPACGLAIVLAAPIIWWYVNRFGFVLLWLAAIFALSWLIAITLVTFATYGYDKTISGSRRTRVPERVLHELSLAGGVFSALAAVQLFRHKTIKSSFLRRLFLILLLYIVILLVSGCYVLIQLWSGVA